MDHDSIELWKKKFTETFLETYFLFVFFHERRNSYFIFPFFLINMRKVRFLLILLLYIHELTCVRTLVGGGEVRERARLCAGRGRELQSPHAHIRVRVFVCVCTCVLVTSPLKHIKAQTKLIHAHTHRWMMDWKSWPIYNVLCFTVIPLRLRPMTSGVASMVWNAYVSHQSQSVAK